jgi:hypothetical protein
MPNYCDCKLTITGPNRQAVLDTIKGDEVFVETGTVNDKPYRTEYIVHFDVDKVVPRPKEVIESGNWADWGYKNWGCRNVYDDRQRHVVHDDSDVIYFYTPWNPPLLAILALSAMFPENSFLLEDDGMDLPSGTTLFQCGKSSKYHSIPNVNRFTGKTATLYEIFVAVLYRTGDVEKAQAEVERVRVERLSPDTPESTTQDPFYDPVLDAEVREIIAPRIYDVAMIPADEERIEDLVGIITQCVSKVQQDISGMEVKSLA